jgi:addiction module HigA family antidote
MSASKHLPMIHPGEILLEEFIKPMDLTLASVARATGIAASRLTEITKGRRSVTAETALRLAKFSGRQLPSGWGFRRSTISKPQRERWGRRSSGRSRRLARSDVRSADIS